MGIDWRIVAWAVGLWFFGYICGRFHQVWVMFGPNVRFYLRWKDKEA